MSVIQIINGFPVGGYRSDLEDRRSLRANATDFSRLLNSGFAYPPRFDARKYLRVQDQLRTENQGQVGSCRGFALSSGGEALQVIASKGKSRFQFSPAYCYYGTQKIDGLLGRDVGSTMNGGMELATKRGIAPEDSWLYEPQYNPNPPGGWEAQYKAAERYTLTYTELKTVEDWFNWAHLGLPWEIGCRWGSGTKPDSQGYLIWSPNGGGGHATMGWGYEGDEELHGMNSWGLEYGVKGWHRIKRRTAEAIIEHPETQVNGLTHTKSPKPGLINFVTDPVH